MIYVIFLYKMFHCYYCNFHTRLRTHLGRHLTTIRHRRNVNVELIPIQLIHIMKKK